MRGPAVQPIVIAAGGTGGHFFPAEALATELIARGHRVVLMTDARSGGLNSAVFANRETFVIRGAGIAGRGLLRGITATASLAAGIIQARGILGRLNVGAMVGFGGYPSVAPVLATRLLLQRRPRVILHEQNAVLGRANRFLARHANAVALSFAETTLVPANTATVLTGNPVRQAIIALAQDGYEPPTDRICLLVLGGSLGARVFSDVVPAALRMLSDDARAKFSVVQQCRAEDLERVRAAYAACGVPAELAAFFPDVADRLRAAHLVIARAGASTVAELAVAGRPSWLVPLPSAIDDHQTANAAALASVEGASILPQPSFTPEKLVQGLQEIIANPAALQRGAAGARRLTTPDATARLATLVESLMRQEARP